MMWNFTNPDWVLENPFGEGSDFINLMRYVNNTYGTQAHRSALRQQLDLFNQLLDRPSQNFCEVQDIWLFIISPQLLMRIPSTMIYQIKSLRMMF